VRSNSCDGAVTACDEHLAVGKQRGRVTRPRGGEAAGRTPGSARRIVQLGARKTAVAVATACDEHLAVGQQCGRVTIPRGGEATGNDKIDRAPLSSQRRAQQGGGSREKEKSRAEREPPGNAEEVMARGVLIFHRVISFCILAFFDSQS